MCNRESWPAVCLGQCCVPSRMWLQGAGLALGCRSSAHFPHFQYPALPSEEEKGTLVLSGSTVCPPCRAPEVTGGSSSPLLTGDVFWDLLVEASRGTMGSVPWARWDVCAALGSTWMGSNFKPDTGITLFCLPSPFLSSPQRRGGSLHGDTWVVTVQLDSLCSRMALYKVIEVPRVASFSLPGTLGTSGSVLLFT